MAATHLPEATINALPESYWANEAAVNGVWNSIIANAYTGTKNYVLQPEGQSNTTVSKQRNDLLVRKIDISQGNIGIGVRLVFEGKRSTSSNTLDQAAGQLSQWLEGAGSRVHNGRKVWCIVARGTKWRAYQYDGGKMWGLSRDRQGNPAIFNGGQVLDVKQDYGTAVRWLKYFEKYPDVVFR